ncbi:MAG TPA: TatD family hydrolase [Candidatus Paceibacterota bacterium]
MIIDAHSHLNDEQYDADRADVILRMKEAGIATVTIGTDLAMSKKAIEIAESNGWWATVGKHPVDNPDEVFDYNAYKELASHKRVVGIGECGLDYYWEKTDEGKDVQKALFLEHIRLAGEMKKPLMMHIRNAYEDGYDLIRSHGVNGVLHFYTGDWNTAKRYLDIGCVVSFPGVITFTDDVDETIKNVPDDSFLIETDAPLATPVPYRGKRNEPTYILEIIKKIARVRGTSPERVSSLTTATAERTFGISTT